MKAKLVLATKIDDPQIVPPEHTVEVLQNKKFWGPERRGGDTEGAGEAGRRTSHALPAIPRQGLHRSRARKRETSDEPKNLFPVRSKL